MVQVYLKMNAILLAALFVVQLSTTNGATCPECVTTYETARGAATDNTGKCTALTSFFTCLVTGTSCPLAAAKAAAITTDYAAISSDCTLSDVCTCQKTYFETDQTAGDLAVCGAVTTYFNCLTGKTDAACDETSTISALATAAESAIPATCLQKTDTCDCQITYTKADVSTDSKKCTATILYYQCLDGKSAAGCDGTVTAANLLTAADTIITGITSCDRTAKTCAVCESEYEVAKAAATDDPGRCTAIKDYLTCLEGAAFCPLTAVQAATIGTDYDAITCTLTEACTCQKTYWMTDLTDDAKSCIAAKDRISCLVGKTDAACDGSSTVKNLADSAKSVIDGIATCSKSDVCDCQIPYATAVVSPDTARCTAVTAYFSCLTGKTNTGCEGTSTVTALATAAESDIPATCAEKTNTCDCQITYSKADVSTDEKKCTALTAYFNCLTGKTNDACDATSTVSALATAAESSFPATCAAKTDTCDCQITYTKADVSSVTNICTAVTTYLNCLTGKTNTGCDGTSTVTALATAAESDIPATCAAKTDTCDCQITYATADVSSDSKKCTAAIQYYQCLAGKTAAGCDGSATAANLQTAADTIIGGITDCDRTAKTCAICESEYGTAKAAATDDPGRCTAIKDYLTCLEGAAFCPLTAVQAATIGTDYDAITCTLTEACTCQKTYWMTDLTDDTKSCTAAKDRISCLFGKTDAACDGSSTVKTLADSAKTVIDGIATCTTTDVCDCETSYATADISTDALSCTAAKDGISCLLGKTNTGCGGSIVKNLADLAKTVIDGISTCTKTDVCDCEIAYATADISSDALRCEANNNMTTCIQKSVNNGCGASSTKTTVGTTVNSVATSIMSTCALTATCQCQLAFNAASISSTDKCASATALDLCLGVITSTTEDACDGTTKTAALQTDLKTNVKNVLCSSPGLKSSIVFSLLMLVTSALLK